ncbi:hypothetical protein Micbo1qcDRAFT_236925 [Microdochium bolleyi]|uniref:Uncharacterized protein n=1 Tax=Microdochium bolleyi TaxID=196109 RepID=A0A136IN70_9PEZI|nr:hypothetical protein Micbo1qcDRAFT_236925 [Microdochium bolleyi]
MADTSKWTFWHDHTGDWSWTMTVPNQHGYYIASFLATIVTLAGASAWNIVSLLIHAHFARNGPATDIFGLQQQVSLRNSPSGLRAAIDAVAVFLSWRGKPGRRRLRRTGLVAIMGMVTWTSFFAASLTTSRAATEITDRAMVRAVPKRCGFLKYTFNNESDITKSFASSASFEDLMDDKWANDTVAARAYALSMQSESVRTERSRSAYMNPKLGYTLEKNVPCALPNNSFCYNNDNATISLTTAKLSSHADLGINAPAKDRVFFQHKATCSIANNHAFLSDDSNYYYYNLGPVGRPNETDATYKHRKGVWSKQVGYQLDAAYAAPNSIEGGYWRPIKGIARKDAELGVVFFSQNGVTYTSPVNDPFFISNIARNFTESSRYKSDWFVRILICAEQFRWCASSDDAGACTEWGNQRRLWDEAMGKRTTLPWNAAQRATAARIAFPTSSISIVDSAVNLNSAGKFPNPLFASNKVRFNLLSSGLPDDQWHKEVSGWFETALADYQATTDEYARKSSGLDAFNVLSPFTDADELITKRGFTHDMMPTLQAQCAEQLVDDTAHVQNFNVVAVIIIIAVSAALVVVSSCFVEILDVCSDWRYRGFERSSRGKIARQADERLHLLRHTLDGATETPRAWGLAPWTGVPVVVGPAGADDDDEKALMTERDCIVQRPVMKGDDLTMYPTQTDHRHSTTSLESTAMLR